jgi:hypothetical protein
MGKAYLLNTIYKYPDIFPALPYSSLLLNSQNIFQNDMLFSYSPKISSCAVFFVGAVNDPQRNITTVSMVSEGLLDFPLEKTLKLSDFNNRVSSRILQRNVLKSLVEQAKTISEEQSTYVVLNNNIDAQLLAEFVGKNEIVIRMRSNPDRFVNNLKRLRDMPPTNRVELFDFSPRSAESLKDMGLPAYSLTPWLHNSERILSAYAQCCGNNTSLASRRIESLFQALKIEHGSVVIIFAHSNGKAALLDTKEGIIPLDSKMISEFGKTQGHLPIVVLLSCNSFPTLVDAFLDAGAPVVFASDSPLRIHNISKFIESLTKKLLAGKDIRDALRESNIEIKPHRLTPYSLKYEINEDEIEA